MGPVARGTADEKYVRIAEVFPPLLSVGELRLGDQQPGAIRLCCQGVARNAALDGHRDAELRAGLAEDGRHEPGAPLPIGTIVTIGIDTHPRAPVVAAELDGMHPDVQTGHCRHPFAQRGAGRVRQRVH